jgi:hypothetical protein
MVRGCAPSSMREKKENPEGVDPRRERLMQRGALKLS